jgi:hypothetical protein
MSEMSGMIRKYVYVTDPPIVSVSPENVTVNETTDIFLFCSYEANPNTLESVSW